MLRLRRHARGCGLAGLLCFAAGAGSLGAQTASWTAPADGYVYDAVSLAVRPVAGFIGSAVLGAPVLSGVKAAFLAPNQKSAIVVRDDAPVWFPDLGSVGQSQILTGVPSIRQVSWAADSTRAVVLAGDGRLLWLNNLADPAGTPVIENALVLENSAGMASGGFFAWNLLAADSTANRVLVTSRTLGGTKLWLAAPNASPAAIAFAGNPAFGVFASGSASAFVADTAGRQIVRLGGLDGVPASTVLPVPPLYVEGTVGVALSSDDSRLFIADRGTKTVHVMDGAGGALLADLEVDSVPFSLTPYGSGRFIVNSGNLPAQPFLFLDTGSPAKILFVPRSE